MKNMIRVTATRRNMAHQALGASSEFIRCYREADTRDGKDFWIDVMRGSVQHARQLRLDGIDYPFIP